MEGGAPWIDAMRRHDFARAWEITDADVTTIKQPKHSGPRHLQRIWRGEPLQNARVLVRCYHGLGDTLQFIRFAKPLRVIAREVIVWCLPALVPLVSRVAGVDRCLPLHDSTPEVAFDADIEIMELAHALRIGRGSVADGIPYISAAPLRDGLREDRLNVGLVWQAGEWDARRAVPPQLLAPLAAIDGVQCYSLNLRFDAGASFCPDLSASSVDVLASRMAALDLIITVDTMAAHLAGAMGLPTWTLLHAQPDWRWGNGDASIWYPTMRLFRQATAGDWSAPVQQAQDTLRHSVRART